MLIAVFANILSLFSSFNEEASRTLTRKEKLYRTLHILILTCKMAGG
jgi:hypothetical protein